MIRSPSLGLLRERRPGRLRHLGAVAALATLLLGFAPSPSSPAAENRGVITLGPRSFHDDSARFDRTRGHWAAEPSARLVAAVPIPDGVAIARLVAGLTIGSPSRGVAECLLIREPAGGGEPEVIASIHADRAGYHPVATTQIDRATVDLRGFRYYLVITLESSTLEERQLFHWIQIEYAGVA